MYVATIGSFCLCAMSVVLGQAESAPVIQAEVVEGKPMVHASVPPATSQPIPVPQAKAAEPKAEPAESPAVKTQHVVHFYEYEPKKRKRGLVEKLFKKLGSDAFEDDYAGTIIVEKMVPTNASSTPMSATSGQAVVKTETKTVAAPAAAPAPMPVSASSLPPSPAPVAKSPAAPQSSAPPVAVVTTPTEAKHGKDYTWIQGRLQKVHVRGGAWIVRYAPLDKVDEHGGSVVLVRDRRIDDFQEGDFVHIDGEILEERASAHLGGPLYRVHHIALLQAAATEKSFK